MQRDAEGCIALGGCTGSCWVRLWGTSELSKGRLSSRNPDQGAGGGCPKRRNHPRQGRVAATASAVRRELMSGGVGEPQSILGSCGRGVMRFGAQRMRPLGHGAEEMGLQPTQPQNSTAETTLPDPAQRGGTNHPQVLLTSPSRAHQGGNCKSLVLFTELSFPCKTPRARGSLQGHLPALPHSASSGKAKIIISFPVGDSSTAMIPSFVPDSRQCWSCSVPVAVVPPLLVLAPSPGVPWMVPGLLPPLLQDLGCDGPHPTTRSWVPLLWALLPTSRISL